MSQRLSQRGRGTRSSSWCLLVAFVLVLLSVAIPSSDAGSPWHHRSNSLISHHLSKRSFFDIQCKGVYDKTIFAKLDRICEDCYNLFREVQVHSLCMSNCFTTSYFKTCVDSLLLNESWPIMMKMVEYVAK